MCSAPSGLSETTVEIDGRLRRLFATAFRNGRFRKVFYKYGMIRNFSLVRGV